MPSRSVQVTAYSVPSSLSMPWYNNSMRFDHLFNFHISSSVSMEEIDFHDRFCTSSQHGHILGKKTFSRHCFSDASHATSSYLIHSQRICTLYLPHGMFDYLKVLRSER